MCGELRPLLLVVLFLESVDTCRPMGGSGCDMDICDGTSTSADILTRFVELLSVVGEVDRTGDVLAPGVK